MIFRNLVVRNKDFNFFNPLMPEFFVFRNIFRISQNTLEKNRKSIFFNQKIKKLLKNRFMCMPPLRVQ